MGKEGGSMMPLRTWLMRFGVSGALLIVAGCGSGDIPDPSSDSQASVDPGVSAAAPPAPVAAPAAAPETRVAAADESPAKPEESKPEEAPAAAEATPPAASSTPDKNSATAEMLAMATGGQPGANPNAPASGDAAPGGAAAPAPGPANGGPPGAAGRMGMPGMGMGPNAPGAGGMNPQMQQQQMQNQMRQMQNQGQAGGGRMAGGMPGMPGSGGGPQGGDNKPANFHTPEGAVTAFLNALKAHDLDRLTEATAIHAQVEARAKNQDMFKRIYDGSLSDEELDNLAKALEGYTLSGNNPPKSSGRIDMIVGKRGQNSYITRLITVRHEKRGWLVCDISGPAEIKNPTMTPYGQPKRK
jgi:hypothetical protein